MFEERSAASGTTREAKSRRPPTKSRSLSHTRRGSHAKGGSSSPSGKQNQHICGFKKGERTKEKACDYWHPPECMNFQTECTCGDKCQYLQSTVLEAAEGSCNDRPDSESSIREGHQILFGKRVRATVRLDHLVFKSSRLSRVLSKGKKLRISNSDDRMIRRREENTSRRCAAISYR